MSRLTGRVKWFSQEKGYGFIRQADGPDVFVHHSAIQMHGFRTLNEGEMVEFDLIEEPKGLKAANVVRVEGGEEPAADGEAPASSEDRIAGDPDAAEAPEDRQDRGMW